MNAQSSLQSVERKRRVHGLLIAVVAFAIVIAQALYGAQAAHASSNLVFSDSFSGTSLDTSKWTAIDGWGPNCCAEVDKNYASNVNVSGGSATLTTRNSTDGGATYSSARIQTMDKFSFLYGTVSVTARMAPGAGMWTSIWLMPATESWPYEIDIQEEDGSSPNTMFTNLHYPTSATSGGDSYAGSGAYNAGVDLTASFHTYTVDWQPGELTFSLDGKFVRSITSHVPDVPMYLIINNQVHASPGNTVWPTTAQVSRVDIAQDSPADQVISEDNLSDFSKTYSHTANTQISSGTPANYATVGQPSNEASRATLTSSAGSTENLVYAATNATGVFLDVYSDPALTFSPPTIYSSPNGSSWTAVSVAPLNDGDGVVWRHSSLNVQSLPTGTNYIKVQFPSPGSNYLATQIAKVLISQATAGATRVDDGDSRVAYTGSGWAQYPDASDFGGNQHYTNASGDYAVVTFTGTSIDFGYTMDNNRGRADVYVDGSYEQTIDFYSSSTKYQHLMYATNNLGGGTHTLKIVNNGTHNSSSTGYFIGIDYLDIQSPSLTRVDDGDSRVAYTGSGWAQYPDASDFGGNQHYTNASGDYAVVTFTGTSIDFGYTMDNNRGRADVYVDGSYEQTIDFYSSSTKYQHLMYATNNLGGGTHTLKIVNNGTHNSSSTGYFIGIDYLDN